MKYKHAAVVLAALAVFIFWQFTSRALAQTSSNTSPKTTSSHEQYQRLLDEQEAQTKRTEDMLSKQEERVKRSDVLLAKQEALLDRMEKNNARYEKILETWEKQQKQYQKYLESLGKTSQPNN